jgi:uncharacterized protein YgiM (DUF1202 family)
MAQNETKEPTQQTQPKKVVEVTANKLNLRNGMGTSFSAIHTLKKGDKLVVVNEKADWLEVVLPPTAPCWVLKKFVEVKADNKGMVKSGRVNARSSASISDNNVIGQINLDAEITILKEDKEWYKISPLPYFTGWINEKYAKDWGDIEKYKVWAAEEESKRLSASKKETELKELFKTTEEGFQLEIEKSYLSQNLEEILENYKRIVKESEDKKMVKTSKERVQFLEPRVAALKEFRQVMDELKKQYKDADDKYQEALNSIMKQFEDKMKPPFIATGTVDYVGKMINRPGTHRLVKGGETIYFLRTTNKAVDLDKFFDKHVGVKGRVVENKGWAQKTVIIESEEDIKLLAEEEAGE